MQGQGVVAASAGRLVNFLPFFLLSLSYNWLLADFNLPYLDGSPSPCHCFIFSKQNKKYSLEINPGFSNRRRRAGQVSRFPASIYACRGTLETTSRNVNVTPCSTARCGPFLNSLEIGTVNISHTYTNRALTSWSHGGEKKIKIYSSSAIDSWPQLLNFIMP